MPGSRFYFSSLHHREKHSINFSRAVLYANLCFKLLTMPLIKCPNCGEEVEYTGNEFRPFCSERCKLLDFGAWADAEYKLPAETSELSDEDIDAIEKAL